MSEPYIIVGREHGRSAYPLPWIAEVYSGSGAYLFLESGLTKRGAIRRARREYKKFSDPRVTSKIERVSV